MTHRPSNYHDCFSNPSAGNGFTKKEKQNKEKPQGHGSHGGAGAAIILRLDVYLCSGGPCATLVQHTSCPGHTFGPRLQHAPSLILPSTAPLPLIPIYPSLVLFLMACLRPRGSPRTGMPVSPHCPSGPVLTGFALLSRLILLGFVLLLLYQPHFLQQAHQAAAQCGFFLWFLLLPLQLNSWRWSRRKGVSLTCLIIHFFGS